MPRVDQARMSLFKKLLAQLQDTTLPVETRWVALDMLWALLGWGDEVAEAAAAHVVPTLVQVLRADWPADGDLSSSSLPVDVVATVRVTARRPHAVEAPRSIRRGCLDVLNEMAHFTPHISAMQAAGLLEPDALPALLLKTLRHVDWKLAMEGEKPLYVPDQTQAAALLMLNTLGSTLQATPSLARHVAEHTALEVAKLFTDPVTLLVDTHAQQRQKLERKARVQRWSEERAEAAMEELKRKQDGIRKAAARAAKRARVPAGSDDFCASFWYYMTRLFHILLLATASCTEEQTLSLIHEGALVCKLNGCLDYLDVDAYLGSVLDYLSGVWDKMCGNLSRQLYARIQDELTLSSELRQRGNAAFKEGALGEAVRLYMKGVKHNPQDGSLWANIALACIKQGSAPQALAAAQEAVEVDPANVKIWCRLGDAWQMMQRHQLAHLCFTMALELSPRDAGLAERQAAARSQLAVVWDIDADVPSIDVDCMTPRWWNWLCIAPREAAAIMRGHADNRLDGVHAHSNESRCIAATRIKSSVQQARAAAVTQLESDRPGGLAHHPKWRLVKGPFALPGSLETWAISWSDSPRRHKKTGLVRHVLNVCDQQSGCVRATLAVLGTPGVAAVRQVMIAAMVAPLTRELQAPKQPRCLFVAYRLFPLFAAIKDMMAAWGVIAVAETKAEALQSAKDHDTDPNGHNADHMVDELEELDYTKEPDPNNGHLSPAPAAAAAGAGSSSSSRGADAHASRDGAGSSSSRPGGVRAGGARSSKGSKRAVPSTCKG